MVLLCSGGMVEDAYKALRARPLTSEVRQLEPLPWAICWALYLGPACTCGSGGAPEQFLVSHVVAADAALALTRSGLGAARARPPPPRSRQGD